MTPAQARSMCAARSSDSDRMSRAPVPPRPTLTSLRKAAAGCKACDLWKLGTQTVFGEGPKAAKLLLIGEQPGNDEDLAGAPFVGPAARCSIAASRPPASIAATRT